MTSVRRSDTHVKDIKYGIATPVQYLNQRRRQILHVGTEENKANPRKHQQSFICEDHNSQERRKSILETSRLH